MRGPARFNEGVCGVHSAMIEVIVIRNLYHQSANKSLTMKLTSWRLLLMLIQFRREFYLLLFHWRAATQSLYMHDFECTSVALSSLLVYIFSRFSITLASQQSECLTSASASSRALYTSTQFSSLQHTQKSAREPSNEKLFLLSLCTAAADVFVFFFQFTTHENSQYLAKVKIDEKQRAQSEI